MKKIIHYVLILDQSGSMSFLKDQVVSTFNEQIEGIKNLKETEQDVDVKVTLCVFNDIIKFKYEAKNIDKVKKLKRKDYNPGSYTALYDAIGYSFVKTEKAIKPEDKVFVAIFTDGLENASVDYTAGDIKQKIKKAEKAGWSVKFFLRNEDIDFYRSKLNLSENYVSGFAMSSEGLDEMKNAVYSNVRDMMGDF